MQKKPAPVCAAARNGEKAVSVTCRVQRCVETRPPPRKNHLSASCGQNTHQQIAKNRAKPDAPICRDSGWTKQKVYRYRRPFSWYLIFYISNIEYQSLRQCNFLPILYGGGGGGREEENSGRVFLDFLHHEGWGGGVKGW